jgi:hypothetical protein
MIAKVCAVFDLNAISLGFAALVVGRGIMVLTLNTGMKVGAAFGAGIPAPHPIINGLKNQTTGRALHSGFNSS